MMRLAAILIMFTLAVAAWFVLMNVFTGGAG
jgi:hypothetical protein